MEGDPVRLITATAVCLALLTTAACSSDPQPAAPPTPTDSVSATSAAPPEDTAPETATETASPSTDALPELPDEAKEQTEAGAEAFVKFYFDMLNILVQDPKPGVLGGLASPNCQTCGAFAENIDTLESAGERMAGPLASVELTETNLNDEVAWVNVRLEQLGPAIVDQDGNVAVAEIEPQRGTILVQVTYAGDSWVLSDIARQPSR
jgi:hypothetical protein